MGASDPYALRSRTDILEMFCFAFDIVVRDNHRLRIYGETPCGYLMLLYLFKQSGGIDHRPRAQQQFSVWCSPSSRRQVVIFFRSGLSVNRMPRVWSANPNQ